MDQAIVRSGDWRNTNAGVRFMRRNLRLVPHGAGVNEPMQVGLSAANPDKSVITLLLLPALRAVSNTSLGFISFTPT